MRNHQMQLTRRHALLAGGTAIALAASPGLRPDAAARAMQRSIQSGGGIAGGGVVALEDGGEAHFSVFGSRFVVEDQDEPAIFGSLIWTDSEGTALVSSEVTDYGPVEDDESSRQMTGTLTMDGEGDYPFTLMLTDGGGPGEGDDTLTLTVLDSGDNAAPSPVAGDAVYSAEGPLVSGDLQLLTFEFEE